jgi:DNA-directed RNA polymerase subunit RPC12/RpoP
MAAGQCSCGKRTSVSDALVGNYINCPRCGASVLVAGAPKPDSKASAKKELPAIHISPGMMRLIQVLIIGGVITTVIRLGPVRVHNQWDAMGPKAEGEVEDVVSFAIQAYLSEQQLYNPRKSLGRPSVDGGVNFVIPIWALTMPEKLKFFGLTQQGRFVGYYHTGTGEIEADIAYGGRTVGGLLVAVRATDQFHITGRDVNGSPQAEVDGTPLTIVYPPANTP